METSVRIIERPLPDSTTTFLTSKEFEGTASNEAVATLQVNTTEIDSFSDLFLNGGTVTSCSEPFNLSEVLTAAPGETTTTELKVLSHESVNSSPTAELTTLKPISAVPVNNLLQSTSTNPTLGTAVLTQTQQLINQSPTGTTQQSELMVTSTTQDPSQQQQQQQVGENSAEQLGKSQQKNVVISNLNASDVFTLTMTDGSIVHLKVQNAAEPVTATAVTTLPPADESAVPSADTVIAQQSQHQHEHWMSTTEAQIQHTEQLLLSAQQQAAQHHAGQHHQSNAACRSSSVSPASFAEEVTLPFSINTQTPQLQSQHHMSLRGHSASSANADLLSNVSPSEVMPVARRSFSVCSENSGSPAEIDSDAETDGGVDPSLLSMFNCVDKVTIEDLKAKLSNLPEGQTDLGALLVAAKIDLTVDEIVAPPLTTVKKIMDAKKLNDWQMTLCLKIRRRKKNTAAVRSSRRKRNQYVVDLREHVVELKRKRHEASTENELLKQLTGLWERLCVEVESEIQDGVKKHFSDESSSIKTRSNKKTTNNNNNNKTDDVLQTLLMEDSSPPGMEL